MEKRRSPARAPADETKGREALIFMTVRALMESCTMAMAARRVLEALAMGGGWQAGIFWLVDEEDQGLRAIEGWQAPSVKGLDFAEASRPYTFRRGEGLPGRAWQHAEPTWVINVTEDTMFPRADLAVRSGLHAAMAFPVSSAGRVVGVIELFSRELRQPDKGQIQLGEVLSGLIGQFVVRQQAEEALVRSNERLVAEAARISAIVESSLDAIVTMDHHGLVTEFNPAAERMFGYTRAEAIGREMAEVIIPERLREAHRRGLHRYLATQEAHILGRHIEMPALRRDGSEFPVELTITRILQPGPPAFTGTMRDLTDRHQAEVQRRELEALRQADQLKDQFLSILSHELRTPINAIMGFGSILDDGLAGALSPTQHEYLRKMLGGADVLLALVNDLLDMSRIQAGQFSLSPAPMRFDDLAEEVLTSLTPLAEQRRHRVQLALPEDLPTLVGDRQRLAQVLVNLVGNAIKFTPAEGVIWLRARTEGPMLHVEVADTGPGIAKEDLPKLFHRFTQLDMSATRKAGGTGLGLSISKALVEAHGGRIGVESEPGRGATFWFDVPLAGPPPRC
jgi:PAS domain S-box-containing protein